MTEPESWVLLGCVAGMYGIRGWLRIHSYTEPRAGILDYRRWWLGDGERRGEYELLDGRMQGAGVVANLAGVADRETARTLLNAEIVVPRGALPPIEGYYWTDLIGLAVVNRAGVALGRITRLIATGGYDVMVVEDDGRERLIPYVPSVYVDEVSLAGRRVTVDWDAED